MPVHPEIPCLRPDPDPQRKLLESRTPWPTPLIPAPKRLRQKGLEFKASLEPLSQGRKGGRDGGGEEVGRGKEAGREKDSGRGWSLGNFITLSLHISDSTLGNQNSIQSLWTGIDPSCEELGSH